MGDLDGDGIPEIIIVADGYPSSKLWVFKGDGSQYWSYGFDGFHNPARMRGAVVANVDEDPEQEIIVAVYDSYYSKEYMYIFARHFLTFLNN